MNANYLYTNLFQEEYKYLSLEELQEKSKAINLTISDEDIIRIESITKDQSTSPYWEELRTGRITSSKFQRWCRTSIENPSKDLIASILKDASNINEMELWEKQTKIA